MGHNQCEYNAELKVDGKLTPQRCPAFNTAWVNFFQGFLCQDHFLVLDKERQRNRKKFPLQKPAKKKIVVATDMHGVSAADIEAARLDNKP